MPEFIYTGSLDKDPLPEVLHKIYNYKVPGVLTAAHQNVTKQIFISGGEIIFASSSLDDDRLGEFLLYSKKITNEQYFRSVELMRTRGIRQGTALVGLGVLTSQELYDSVKDQVRAIVWSLFNWNEGQITFKVGQYKDDEIIKLNLDTRDAILQGIKAIKEPKRVVRWMGRKEDIFEPDENVVALLPGLPIGREDKQVLRLVDGVRSFLEVLQASALDSTATAKILYGLYVLGLIRRKAQAPIKITAPSAKPAD
jgi:hypothetical protein